MADTFADFVQSERNRINEERQRLVAERGTIDGQLAALDRELSAIEAYEKVKSGNTGTRAAPSGRRTGIREQVLSLVKQHPDGLTAAAVIQELNATGDSDKTSVRNALSALKRNNSLGLKGGSYIAA